MGVDNTAPRQDQIELSVLGPGYGECCLIHVGSGKWIIIDSCLDLDGKPAALQYLRGIGVDPANSVAWIIATHWHDDHIRGLADTLRACKTASFCSSSALGRKEFLATVAPYNERANFIGGSGISELFEVLEELNTSQRCRPTRACPDRRIDRIEAVDLAHDSKCEVWTLSPSDLQFDKFLADIGSMVPQLLQTKRRLLPQKSNLLSVVTLVRIGSLGILLGADLEELGNPETGWSAIVRSKARPLIRSKIFKVPHHGSENAHCQPVWDEMLDSLPTAVTTPYQNGRVYLPRSGDTERIAKLSESFYLTSKPLATRIRRRSSVVDKMIRQVGTLRPIGHSMGTVRFRNGGKRAADTWHVELSEGAIRVNLN